eukprot:gb/GECH01012515.1/.p1 GENE.gb/GECH01012515.1/~~gb/GECH01012515.1/.p1  ORF type:complete len:249 (+),score=54.91 gb/GECH01012515.1/:1-747(+)
MFRNHYDTDVTTWSPAGRLYQVEYAMEAVKQGSATVGLKSDNFVVLASLKRAPHAELSSYQRKIFRIDSHIGIAIAGLTADARVLSRYMINQALNHRYIYDSSLPVNRLVTAVADKSQVRTQAGIKRPFGVGMLVAGYDDNGPHLYETCPSGNFYSWKAISIGARAQSAKTYLERNFENFKGASESQLIHHALKALQGTTGDNVDLNTRNCSVAIVGKDNKFTIYEDEDVEQYLNMLEEGGETQEMEA